MKKITFLLFIAFVLSFNWQSNAQVTIGDGTYNSAFNTYPFNPYYGYSYAQSIYLASEINTTGDITALSFEMVDSDAIPNSDDMIDLWIGHTTKTEFSSTTDWVDVSTLTQVMTSGTLTKSGTTITFTFSAPFTYNGTDNLIIALDANEAGYDSSADKLYGTDVVQNRTLRQMSDSVNSDPASPATGTLTNYIGNTTFMGIVQACPSPSGMTASNVTATSAELSWTAGASETQWHLEWNADTDFTPGTGTSGGSAGPNPNPNYTAMGLTPDTTYYIYYRADCGGGETSAWVGPFIGTTLESCGEPLALTASALDVSATISWTAPTAGTPTGYNWEVQPDGVTQGTAGAITGSISGTTDSVTGLTASTPYDLFVQTDCGAVDGMSTWAGPYSFTTNSGPPPANDECAGATMLTVEADETCSSPVTGTTTNASQSLAGCLGTSDDDVWYSFIASETVHTITINNTAGSTDIVTEVFDACGGTQIVCQDTPNSPIDLTGLTASTTYYFRIYTYFSNSSSDFEVCVGTPPTDTLEYYNLQWPPSGTITDGDGYNVYAQCYEAGLTDATSGQAAGVECWIGYSSSDTDPSGTGWTWVAATFDSESGNNDQYVLDLDGSVGVGTYYYASRWSQNLGPYTYGGIQADGSYGGTWGADNNISGMLTVNAPPPPANDDCAGAVSLTVETEIAGLASATQVPGTIASATDSGITGCAGTADDDVWYSFTATVADINIDVTDDFDGVIELFSGACGSLTSVECDDYDSTYGNPRISRTDFVVGETYYLRVYYYYGTTTSSPGFTTAIWSPSALSIDDSQFERFQYYPNPVEGTLSLRAQENMQNVAVFNMLGQEVINISPNAMSNDLDMSALSRGTYFVRISINGAVENFKIIKE